jgi:hypothetical protein
MKGGNGREHTKSDKKFEINKQGESWNVGFMSAYYID